MGLSKRREQLCINLSAGIVLGSTVLFGCQSLIGLSEYNTGPGDSGASDGGTLDAREQDAAKDVIEPPPPGRTIICDRGDTGCVALVTRMSSASSGRSS